MSLQSMIEIYSSIHFICFENDSEQKWNDAVERISNDIRFLSFLLMMKMTKEKFEIKVLFSYSKMFISPEKYVHRAIDRINDWMNDIRAKNCSHLRLTLMDNVISVLIDLCHWMTFRLVMRKWQFHHFHSSMIVQVWNESFVLCQ